MIYLNHGATFILDDLVIRNVNINTFTQVVTQPYYCIVLQCLPQIIHTIHNKQIMNTIHNIKIILYILYTSCCSFILLVLQHISCVSSAYSDSLSSFQCVHCSLCTCNTQHAVFMQCAARSSVQLVVCVQCPCSFNAVFSL